MLASGGQNNLHDFSAIFSEIESNLNDVKNLLNSSNDEKIKEFNLQIKQI
jgi:hypothetical protein